MELRSADRDQRPVNLFVRATAQIVAAYVACNRVAPEALPDLLRTVYGAVALVWEAAPETAERPKPAVPIRASVQHDFIICLEDGKKLKLLKRYLHARYGLSPDQYRARWNLPPDYPMAAPAYAETRSVFAKRNGLGRSVRPGKGESEV